MGKTFHNSLQINILSFHYTKGSINNNSAKDIFKTHKIRILLGLLKHPVTNAENSIYPYHRSFRYLGYVTILMKFNFCRTDVDDNLYLNQVLIG